MKAGTIDDSVAVDKLEPEEMKSVIGGATYVMPHVLETKGGG